MRWPWVSRARFENEREARRGQAVDMAKLQSEVEFLRESQHTEQANSVRWVRWFEDRRQEADARHDALLEKYHALRVQGAAVPEPKPQISPAKPQGPIAEAIDEVCSRYGNSVKLRRRLMKYAEDMKRSDGEEAEIAHAILHWRSPDDDEAVA